MLAWAGTSLGENAAFTLIWWQCRRATLVCPNDGIGEWALSHLKESFPPDGTGKKNKLCTKVTEVSVA